MPIIDETFKPRYNGYRCMICGRTYLTVDLGDGVTPMFMTCLMDEECGGKAVSLGYPSMKALFGAPLLVEWVVPSAKDTEKITHQGLLDHFAQGGLMRRAVDTAPEWVKNLV